MFFNRLTRNFFSSNLGTSVNLMVFDIPIRSGEILEIVSSASSLTLINLGARLWWPKTAMELFQHLCRSFYFYRNCYGNCLFFFYFSLIFSNLCFISKSCIFFYRSKKNLHFCFQHIFSFIPFLCFLF